MAIVHGCGGVCGRNEYIREAQPPFRSYLQGASHTIIVQVGSGSICQSQSRASP